jgi:hypothetical protein
MKKIPKFKSEAEERAFWQEHDSTEYLDWSDAREVTLPKLRASTLGGLDDQRLNEHEKKDS